MYLLKLNKRKDVIIMPRFSIIVPVYNVEKYIEKCIDSIEMQTYNDYEVIVVNDGTKDNSINLIKNRNVKIINQKNNGLSAARNTGVKHAKGEYLIFLDSDDYWEEDLLMEINKSLENKPDLVRFQIQEVKENSVSKKKYPEYSFIGKKGEEAFELITKYHFVENAWCYAIKRKYYLKEKFTFKEGTIHEDFGLIPLIIIKAKNVNSISYIGYNYLQRTGSIMNSDSYEKTKKKVADFYTHYSYLIQEINKTSLKNKFFKSFVANSMLLKICELNKKEYKYYLKKLKKEGIFDYLLSDTLPRKIKKIVIMISPRFYFHNHV